jgi:hypothetical protein
MMAPNLAWRDQLPQGPSPRASLLQWWSRNHRLQTQLGKLLLRDGAILSKQPSYVPCRPLAQDIAGHCISTTDTQSFENENRL